MATENVEDGAKPSSSNETDGSLERKIGLAKKFDKEMKDYAKATVKEFLGIYGYEEDVDINMDDSGEAHKTGAAANVESSKESGTSSETNQPSRPTLGESVSTTAAPTTNSFDMERGTTGPQETSVSISSSTNPNYKPQTMVDSRQRNLGPGPTNEGHSASETFQDADVFGEPDEASAPCRWCKKLAHLQSFTYVSDNTKVVYEGLCSTACFENVRRIRQGKDVGYSSRAKPVSAFSWDTYLAETHGTAAPWTCFKQSSSPPVNGFQVGMKLEAADPRNDGTVCVATVVGVLAARLRLRFDGCDNTNDIWRMVDCSDIHPVGWCEGNGGVLQPPVGYRRDVGKFSSFLTKTLADGELAPLRLFKREPQAPKCNFFAPTHKLEAIDLKNPALICVATVVEVVGDYIKIVFDGWRASTKYTYRYDSRDIFPVGWCYFSGHPLQPPGPEYTKARKSSSDKHHMYTAAVRPLDVPGHSSYPRRSRGSPSIATADSASEGTSGQSFNFAASRLTLRVELFVNHACDFGSYLDPTKVADLPLVFRGRVAQVLPEAIQAIVNAAFNPKTVLGFLQPGKGKVVIKAHHGNDTYTCCLQNVERVREFWNVIARFSDNLRCCKNLFSNTRLEGICPKCQHHDFKTVPRRKPEVLITNIKRKAKDVEVIERSDSPKKARSLPREELEEREEAVGSTSSPTIWSTDEVVKYFKASDIAQYAEVFRDHEIDGAALLLLNRETIMTCMQFKLGPALKLLNNIDQLKKKYGL